MATISSKKNKDKGHYLLGIYDPESHKQIAGVKASLYGLILGIIGVVVVLVVSVVLLIMYTPLRELVPGYPNAQMRSSILNNALRADSLERVIHLWEVHLENVQRVLNLEDPLTPEEMEAKTQEVEPASMALGARSKEDSLLRATAQQQEQDSQKSIKGSQLQIEGVHFFPPLKGVVTAGFNPAENHYAIDIVAPENSVISAVLDGTVNFASWTDEYGYVLQIQHENNLLSTYKHCSKLFKKVGDQVTAGSAVAVLGSSGTYSTGPHLHFELWHKGVALNPQDYINF